MSEQGNAESPSAEPPSTSAPPATPTPPPAGGSGCLPGCLWLFFGSLGLIVLVAIVSAISGPNDDEPDEPTAWEAEHQCEEWVRNKLKAPSTAEFSGTTSVGGPVSWSVSGTVDAENSFGAMLRSTWTCEIRLDGDTWRGSTQLG